MWRTFWFIVVLLGTPAGAFSQADSSDSQTLHALLSEVHALHQDLLSSMARVQKSQVLLSRLQTQQVNVASAFDRFNTARGRLSDVQDHEKHTATDIKRSEDALSAEQNVTQQKQLRDMLDHLKSELEDSTAREQRAQTEEIEAEQQLKTEQDKFTALEAQLDELIKTLGNAAEQVRSVH